MNLVWSRATQSHFVGKLDVLLFFGGGGKGGYSGCYLLTLSLWLQAYIIDDSSLLSWTCSRCQGITKVCDCANSCQKRFCFVPSLDLHQQFRFLDQI
jgi:hypothetical protein